MTKKILAVVLAVIMITSTFVMGVSAISYSPTLTSGEVKFILTADKTTVAPGDTVTFTMSIDAGSKSDLAAFGIAFGYNKAQLSYPAGATTAPTFRTWEGDCADSFANPSAGGNLNYVFGTQNKAYLTTEEQAYYNGGFMILGSSTSTANRWNPAAGEAFMTFQMVVSDAVSAGDEIWIGAHDAGWAGKKSYLAVGGTTRLALTEYDTSDAMVKLTVAASGPVVDKAAAQVKFTADGASVADEFKLRIKSVITDADWDTYFANTADTAATTDKLTEVGIVAYKGTADFDAATAKGVVNGTPAANYAAASTDYIQKADDSSDAYFGAIIDLAHSTCTYDITYMGYAKYLDGEGNAQIIFYPTEYVAGVSTNYDAAVNTFLA